MLALIILAQLGTPAAQDSRIFGGVGAGPSWSNIGHGAGTGIHVEGYVGVAWENAGVTGGLDAASFEYDLDFLGEIVVADITLSTVEARCWWLPQFSPTFGVALYSGLALTNAQISLGPLSDDDGSIGVVAGLDLSARLGGGWTILTLGAALRTYGVHAKGMAEDDEVTTVATTIGLRWNRPEDVDP